MTSSYDSSSTPYLTPQGGDAWARDAARQGKVGTQQLLGVEQVDAAPQVRDALRLKPGERVVVRRRLILADEQPVELADSIYPVGIAGDTALTENAKIKGGATSVLTSLGHGISDALEQVTARLPNPNEAIQLGIPADEPILVVTRVGRDSSGRPVELAFNRMVASRTEPLSYKLRIGE